ncbi:hypothetical protein COU54_05325 [Candidatus Pacearchaeota archaeon CG10_big_fil_rev_8_21_14_0_10_31_24]|nr:MAG: hypothetical protein COU54_05325 [Candidatus Pacearchaeota archaeon CG10_big_fil_rev_8_21_14_0_10_31_24]
MTDNQEKTENRKTFIIAGVNGDIGQEFAKSLSKYGRVYGISRSSRKMSDFDYTHLVADFLNPEQIKESFEKIELSDDITYIHLIGKFLFEDENHPIVDRNGDGINDVIYDINCKTFKNALPVLLDLLKEESKRKLKVISISAVMDLYDLPFFNSFTKSKDELRKEFRVVYGAQSNYGRVSSLMINVATVKGHQLSEERPFMSEEDKAFCLSPKEVIDQSLEHILDSRNGCIEISLVKPNPSFGNSDYLDIAVVKKRWYRDMYGPLAEEKMKGGGRK